MTELSQTTMLMLATVGVIVVALLVTGFGFNRTLRYLFWDETAGERRRREEAERRRGY